MSLILLSIPAVSVGDAYLDALEAEAESSSDAAASPQQSGNNQNLLVQQQAQRKKEFETRLFNELPATFKTYRMLNKDDKEKVVETYFASDKNMPVTTRVLFNLYFKIR